MTTAELAERLGAKRVGKDWTARCPAHEDSTPSLSISEGREGRVLVKCHAGCSTAAILGALGKTERDLFPNGNGNHGSTLGEEVAAYDYCDENGALLFQVVRYRLPKGFRQRRPDGRGDWIWKLGDARRVLYRLPELLQRGEDAIAWITEGEKDADALAALGLCATTNSGGAGKWRSEYADALKGADVCVVPDNDQAGRTHAQDVARQLHGVAARVRIVAVPRGKDASEFLELGGTVAELDALADATPRWSPDTSESVPPVPDRPPAGDPAPLATSPLEPAAPEPFPTIHFLEGDPPPPPLLHVDRLLLAENFNLFAGAKSSGKSPTLLTVAVSIALGLPCFGTLEVHRPGNVLLVVPEDGQDFARTACDAIAVGLGLMAEDRALLTQRLTLVPDTVRMDLVRDVRRLRRTVEAVGAVALILDPMKRLLPGSDENDNSLADLVAGELLHEICRGAACTVAAAMHEKKPNAKTPDAEPSMHNVRGASAWYAASRMTFNVSQNTASRTIKLHCTAANRVRPDDQHHTLRLAITAHPGNPAAWTSCTLTDLDDGASESLTPGVGRALKESERTALHMLEDEPDTALSWSQWSKRASLPERTFGYAKKTLQKAGLVESVPTGKKVPGGGEAKVYRITPAGRNALVGDTARIEE